MCEVRSARYEEGGAKCEVGGARWEVGGAKCEVGGARYDVLLSNVFVQDVTNVIEPRLKLV